MAHIKLLVDRKTNDIILPHTISQAVYHDGSPMSSVICSMQSIISEHTGDISDIKSRLKWKEC